MKENETAGKPKDRLSVKLFIPNVLQIIGALGAAIIAQELANP
jgi:activator of 2-hydroxyglutaryl-CoA dehydratase